MLSLATCKRNEIYMNLRSLFLFVLSLILVNGVKAQSLFYPTDATEIIIEKSGQLEKLVKKANAQDIKKLVVKEGPGYADKKLNVKDLQFLATMSQLEELYIDAEMISAIDYYYKTKALKISIYGKGTSEEERDKIMNSGIFTNATFPNLKVLGIGKNTNSEVRTYMFNIKIPSLVLDEGVSLYNGINGVAAEDVYIISDPHKTNSNSKDYQEFMDSKKKWQMVGGEYPSRIHAVHVDSLYNIDEVASLNPAIIYYHTPGGVKKILNDYNGILSKEDKDLSQYDGILSGALYGCSFDKLILPDNQEFIGKHFFENTTINHLDLNKVKKLKDEAFSGSHIKEIRMPSSVQDIQDRAFDDSEIEVICIDGIYPPAISSSYAPEAFKKIQFMIPKGAAANYNIGAWKELRVLEEGANTDYSFDVLEPGTLASLLTDDIKRSVVSLKLRGILFSDDIRLLEDCPNLRYLDLGETFITQSPKELKEQQEMADYLIGTFMGMGIIAQSEYEHDRISTIDNIQVQYLAKLAEMAKDEKVQSDPNCQKPRLNKTHIEELILPLQLQEVDGYIYPDNLKKITLPPDLKAFYASPYTSLTEIILPASVEEISITSSNIKYKNLQSIDMSACENPTIKLEAEFENLNTLKFPESYVPFVPKGSKTPNPMKIYTSTLIGIYFKNKELACNFSISAPEGSKIYIPRGSRAGYSNIINDRYEIIEY